MKQDTVAGKILIDLTELGIATEDNEWILYNYLMQAYATGFDGARLQSTYQKPVAQYNLEGRMIGIFDNAAVASRKTGTDHSDIIKCTKGKAHTAGGFKWESINLTKPSSGIETIASVKLSPKPPQPKPKIHSSKTD